MVTVRFRVVSRVRTDRYRCPCGKQFQRSVRVEQTINPWNKNAAGVPKTWVEIWEELGEELAEAKTDAVHTCGQTGDLIARKPLRGAPLEPGHSTEDGAPDEWAVEHHNGTPPVRHESEEAARATVGTHQTLMRRRPGGEWQEVSGA